MGAQSFLEEIARDIHSADTVWKIILLRYFNPVGAHESGKLGEDPIGILNNLMPYIQQVVVGRLPELNVYGHWIELSLCGNLLRPGLALSTIVSATSIKENDSLIVKIDDKYFTWDKAAHTVLGMAAYDLQMPIDPNDSIPDNRYQLLFLSARAIVQAYLTRSFLLNLKQGEVAISHRMDMKGKSYTSLHTLVNDMFPPTSMIEQEDFNSWNYWRVSLPDVE
ncbi:hypothetical protein L1887_19260 [Cichorium endivia]|nr:hypothetical protein L1887_19260 [Cichorium endivia]